MPLHIVPQRDSFRPIETALDPHLPEEMRRSFQGIGSPEQRLGTSSPGNNMPMKLFYRIPGGYREDDPMSRTGQVSTAAEQQKILFTHWNVFPILNFSLIILLPCFPYFSHQSQEYQFVLDSLPSKCPQNNSSHGLLR